MQTAPPPPLFPLFLDLRGRRVLVVGGGAVAARKIAALLEAGATVQVVANALEPGLAALVSHRHITHLATTFAPTQLEGAWLCFQNSSFHLDKGMDCYRGNRPAARPSDPRCLRP